MKRKKTRQIRVGDVAIGGGAPVSVQSMTNTDTREVASTVAQIKHLEKAGCEIVRLAVPDEEAAESFRKIKDRVHIPLIADIHFDHRLAIAALRAGADGLRINPGNIGSRKAVEEVVREAQARRVPIRVGVNAGSLHRDILAKYGHPTPEAMVESALRHVQLLENLGFQEMKISLKSSNVQATIRAYELLSTQVDYPLHLGVTEAGTLVAWEILRALDLRARGPEIISCPTCGRCEIDLFRLVERVEKGLEDITASPKVAIMGCIVNGPGEAREADVGVAGGRGQGILFRKGELVRKIPESDLADILISEVQKTVKQEIIQGDRPKGEN
ncbi:MAG: 4-hydroxy-3-methylbut-2-en-1-yl diphosphate synthase [Desulfobacteraceae bacterium 4484_190.3]|nr:MAG: 4-hydroxy-3-methylbut-2-en-1-yl diphosphate synthase [Desulfobacteraceae bacterium 4484_190.3]